MMRIVHVAPSIDFESSGLASVVLRYCELGMAQKQDVGLVTLDFGLPSKQVAFLTRFKISAGPKRLGCSSSLKRWLYAQRQMATIDVIHNHGMWQMNAIYPSRVAKRRKMELVISPHGALAACAMQSGSVMKKLFWPLLQRPALRRATCFHAASEREYDDIRRLGFKQPIAIIPHGIDIPALLPLQRQPMRTLLFLGRLHAMKGVDVLLQAWCRLEHEFSDWQLVIVGSDEEYWGSNGCLDKFQLLACQLNLQRVQFLGEKVGADKQRIYQEAELYVLPSFSENYALTVAEALASGTPVIVGRGTPWSAVEREGAGWWVDVEINTLCQCLHKALSMSSAELKRLGFRGRQWMKKDYTWDQVGWKMNMTYQWLLDRFQPVPSWIQLE